MYIYMYMYIYVYSAVWQARPLQHIPIIFILYICSVTGSSSSAYSYYIHILYMQRDRLVLFSIFLCIYIICHTVSVKGSSSSAIPQLTWHSSHHFTDFTACGDAAKALAWQSGLKGVRGCSRYSVYFIYWYKSASSDAAGAARGRIRCTSAPWPPQFTCFTGTKVQVLTLQAPQGGGSGVHQLPDRGVECGRWLFLSAARTASQLSS
jgi:hypothetical protein